MDCLGGSSMCSAGRLELFFAVHGVEMETLWWNE